MVKTFGNMVKKFRHTVFSCYVCLKYPFLYPRNRFTGLHYNNWNIINKLKELYSLAYKATGSENGFKPIIIDKHKARRYKLLKWYHDKFLQVVNCVTTYNELDALKSEAPGWYKAFGWQMCKEIKKSLLETGGKKLLRSYRITKIKEKYGELCWYTYGDTKETSSIIAKYEYISKRTCVDCGKSATCVSRGYVLPYCDKCFINSPAKAKDDYYTEDMPFYGHYIVGKKNKYEDNE